MPSPRLAGAVVLLLQEAVPNVVQRMQVGLLPVLFLLQGPGTGFQEASEACLLGRVFLPCLGVLSAEQGSSPFLAN